MSQTQSQSQTKEHKQLLVGIIFLVNDNPNMTVQELSYVFSNSTSYGNIPLNAILECLKELEAHKIIESFFFVGIKHLQLSSDIDAVQQYIKSLDL